MGLLSYTSGLPKVNVVVDYKVPTILSVDGNGVVSGIGMRAAIDLADALYDSLLGKQSCKRKFIKTLSLDMGDVKYSDDALIPEQDDVFVVNFFHKDTNLAYVAGRTTPCEDCKVDDVSKYNWVTGEPKAYDDGASPNYAVAPFYVVPEPELIEKVNKVSNQFYGSLSFVVNEQGEVEYTRGSHKLAINSYLGTTGAQQFIALAKMLLSYRHLSPKVRKAFIIDAGLLKAKDVMAIVKLCEACEESDYMLFFFGLNTYEAEKGEKYGWFPAGLCQYIPNHLSVCKLVNTRLGLV